MSLRDKYGLMKSIAALLSGTSICFLICAGSACNVYKNSFQAPPKSDPEALKQDLKILYQGLQKYHPSLYAYCTKEELEKSYHLSLQAINDSLTESAFAYRIVAPFIAHIRCGHTSVAVSHRFRKYNQTHPPAGFPLLLKFFGDTMMVSRNLIRTDSILKRGTILLSINGLDSRRLKDELFSSFPMDGYAATVNLARLNNNFPFYHRMVMGVDSPYMIKYLDENNSPKTISVPAYQPGKKIKNTSVSKTNTPKETPSIRRDRTLQIDSTSRTAYLYLANFENPLKFHQFIRKSFEKLKIDGIQHLIIDLRTNGGGVIDNEVFLARHLRESRFRVADTAVAISRQFRGYGKYFNNEWINGLILQLFTRKDDNGLFHMTGYWEKREFKPVRNRFFNGKIYILTGGMTFSAASLFCKTMKGQQNVWLIGEETGGSGYANNGLLIPDFVLPNSKIRVRMPLFRLVPDSGAANNGRGVMPDIPISPTSISMKQGYDPVMVTTWSMIRAFENERIKSANLK